MNFNNKIIMMNSINLNYKFTNNNNKKITS